MLYKASLFSSLSGKPSKFYTNDQTCISSMESLLLLSIMFNLHSRPCVREYQLPDLAVTGLLSVIVPLSHQLMCLTHPKGSLGYFKFIDLKCLECHMPSLYVTSEKKQGRNPTVCFFVTSLQLPMN